MRLEVDDGLGVRSVRVARSDVTLGRSSGADVRLDASGVSRRHVPLRVVGDAVLVVDLGSRNGLRVLGRQVPQAMLGRGDSFELGGARITVLETAPQAPTAGRPPPTSRPGLATHHDFDELLYGALRKTPWYLASLAVHTVVLLVLAAVDLGLSGAPPPAEDVVVALSDGSADDALDDRIAELLVDDALDDLERMLPDDQAELPVELEPVEPEDPADDGWLQDPEVVLERSALPFGSDVPGSAPVGLLPTGAAGTPLGRSFGKDEAGDANAFAARQLRSSPFTRRILEGVRLRTSHVNVRVLGGEYDQCEDVLTRLGLEHDTLLPEELDLAAPGREIRAIFYNCTSKPLTERALDHLERFVRDGGYLFTTDWGLENVLERRFSRYVRTLRRRGRVVMTDDEVIGFQPVATHPLLRGLPDGGRDSRWWLENSSVLVDIVDRRNVEVLIESDELQRRHGSRVVAVTFEHGRGRVVHVLGHFFQKEGNLRGTVAMQRILLNFLYQALRST